MATKNSAPAAKPAIDLSKCLCFTPEGMARQLENYTRSVFRVVEEYQVLYGSAVSVRKAMDSMGAYLITRHTEGGEINPPTDGIDTNSNSSILNRLRQAAKSKHVIKPFIALWEQILPDRKSKMTGLQTLFHYQPVSAASEEQRREEEKENLKLDYRIFFDHLITYKKLVRQFLSIAGDVDTVIDNNKEECHRLNALRSEPDDPARLLEENLAERTIVTQHAVNAIVGRTVFKQTNESGAFVRTQTRDFLIGRNNLDCEPAAGDTIRYDGREFEVMAPGGEPVWRWSDPYHQVYRIHTKCVSEE